MEAGEKSGGQSFPSVLGSREPSPFNDMNSAIARKASRCSGVIQVQLQTIMTKMLPDHIDQCIPSQRVLQDVILKKKIDKFNVKAGL